MKKLLLLAIVASLTGCASEQWLIFGAVVATGVVLSQDGGRPPQSAAQAPCYRVHPNGAIVAQAC